MERALPALKAGGGHRLGLSHLDSRPYELAAARTSRSPQAIDGYRAELARLDWPLSDLEEAALGPICRCFRVDLAAWQIDTAGGPATMTWR